MVNSDKGALMRAGAHLREIAGSMSESLLERPSGIEIEVRAEALEIDRGRAVPLGLPVNELGTNADQIEPTVADDGVGMKHRYSVQIYEKVRLPLLVAAHLKN
jgi:hypothetical protein